MMMNSKIQWTQTAQVTYSRLAPETHKAITESLELLKLGRTLANEIDFTLIPGYQVAIFSSGYVLMFRRQRQSWYGWKYMLIIVEDIAPSAQELVIKHLLPKESPPSTHSAIAPTYFSIVDILDTAQRLLFSHQIIKIIISILLAFLVGVFGPRLSSSLIPAAPPPLAGEEQLIK